MLKKIAMYSFLACLFMFVKSAPAQETEKRGIKEFDWHSGEQSPEVLRAIEKVKPFESAELKSNPEGAARKYLGVLGPRIMGAQEATSKDINKVLEMQKSFEDQIGDTTVVFRQTHRNVPVYGSDVRVHMTDKGTLRSVTTKYVPQITVSTIANISPKRAMDIAWEHSNPPEKLKRVSEKTPELFVYPSKDSKYYLVWLVEIPGVEGENPARWKYFIDAQEGKVVNRFNDLKFQTSVTGKGKGIFKDHDPLFITQLSDTDFVLEDISMVQPRIRTLDFTYRDIQLDESELPGDAIKNASLQWNDPKLGVAVDAHYFARLVFDYYWTAHGRNSLDNNGMDLISSVRATYWQHIGPGSDPKKWNNAVWTGTQMIYGDGDGIRFAPLSGALDVVAHEFTHGVTDKTANLEYQDQSGALNESYSDIFATMIDTENWLLGEDVFTPQIQGDAMRSLEDPTKSKPAQPDHMRNYLVTSNDNGGVHSNSGIPNKVAYLLSVGGTHNNIAVQPLGRELTAQIYYLTLTKYLSQFSDFTDARRQTLKACEDVRPGDTQVKCSVQNAFASVGIGAACSPN